jgi:vitamin B12/bleomycin/antimicrobial peptide transport system ATP-binding/permease protein
MSIALRVRPRRRGDRRRMTQDDGGPRPVSFKRLAWARFVRALSSFAGSEVGATAKLKAAKLIGLLVAINALNVLNSYVGRDFMTAIAQRSMNGFIRQALTYLGVFAASTVVAVVYRFTEERLGLLWREWMTRQLVNAYLEHPTYYRLNDRLSVNGEIANPDQRIADDVRVFTVTTISFVLMLLNASITVIAFSGVMWSISPLLFGIGVSYALAGSYATIRLGTPLVGLNYAQLDREANFRADLVHLRQRGESVALLRHEERLKVRLLRRLEQLTNNFRQIIAVNRNLSFFTTGYNYLIQIIPALVVAPLFIRGEVEFGAITQSTMAFTHLLGAFSLIITQFASISSFSAVLARLDSLTHALDKARPELCEHHRRINECPICQTGLSVPPAAPAILVHEDYARIAYEHLTLRSPRDSRVLIDELNVSIRPGTRVQILGANAAAKVALFRATADIWDVGDGHVTRPGPGGIMFLPEQPYVPLGTLRGLLEPPEQTGLVPDRRIDQTIAVLHLETTIARAGGLDTEQDWGNLLSLGEQQLLGVARLLLAAPRFAFLDRPHTALNGEQLELVLQVLSERSITYLTIGDSKERPERYDAALELKEDGSWQWRLYHPAG